MDAKRHARLIVQPYAPLAGHVVQVLKLDVSVERSSPRGYAFFVPLGGGERPFGFTPTFTRRKYYSKTAARLRGGFSRKSHMATSIRACAQDQAGGDLADRDAKGDQPLYEIIH